VPVTALFGWIDHEWPKIEHSRRQYDARMKSRSAYRLLDSKPPRLRPASPIRWREIVRFTTPSTRVSASELTASKNRYAWGSESTHCRSERPLRVKAHVVDRKDRGVKYGNGL
jgi:hypothetical protein